MRMWIDVEDRNGNKLGDGPIASAQEWEHHRLLDKAGTFRFSLPASDPRCKLLEARKVVRCYAGSENGPREIGAGIINRVRLSGRGDSLMREVSGPDILEELATRTVGPLAICEQKWTYLNEGKGMVRYLTPSGDHDRPEAYDGDLGTSTKSTLDLEYDQWLYVGYDARFGAIEIDFAAVNGNEATLQYQYYSDAGWRDFPVLDDQTKVGNVPFARDGVISWTRPADWSRCTPTKAAGSWFWMRMRRATEGGNQVEFKLTEIRAYVDVPTTNGISQIMAYAPNYGEPGGWSVSNTSPAQNQTDKEAYLLFGDQTVLAALIALAEEAGEHFRVGNGRVLEWLGNSEPLASVRAVGQGDPIALENNEDVCVITRATEEEDAHDLATRVIPYGAGLGGGRITLVNTDRQVDDPTNYSLDVPGNCITATTAEGQYGQIEAVRSFNNILSQQLDSEALHGKWASNALFDAAYSWLKEHSTPARFYDLDVAKAPADLRPGQKIHVVYQDWVDGYCLLDVNTYADDKPLHLIGTVEIVSPEGVFSVGLDVSNVRRHKETDASAVVGAIRDLRGLAGIGADGGGSTVIISGRSTNAETVDGIHAATAPTAGMLLALDLDKQFPASVLKLDTNAGLEVVEASSGLAINSGFGLTLNSDVLLVDASSAPGAAERVLKSTASGGLTLQQLTTDSSADFAANTFRVIHHTHDYDHSHLVINPGAGWTLDEQFGLDIDDNLLVRGWIVGKHAIQLSGALMLCHFDGPEPYNTDFTGNPTGHMGQVAEVSGGVIYRPGVFGKGVQVAEATTNLVVNPSVETNTNGYSPYATGTTVSRVTDWAMHGQASLRAVCDGSTAGQGIKCTIADLSVSTQYTFTLCAKGEGTMRLRYRDITNNQVSDGSDVTLSGEPQRLALTFTTNANPTTHAFLVIYVSETAAVTFWVDGWQLEQRAYPTPYCDGSLGPGHSWSGTEHASTSSRAAAELSFDAYAADLVKSQGSVFGRYVAGPDALAQRLFDVSDGTSTNRILLSLGAANKFALFINGANRISAVGSGAEISWGDEFFWCITWDFDADEYALYVYEPDGEGYSGTSSTALSMPTGLVRFNIGTGHAAGYHCDGVIDEFGILDRVLSPAEVRAIYESNAPVFAETSTWHWRSASNAIWADAEGFWARDQDGNCAFAVSAIDSKSWGGLTLDMGDVLLGHNQSGMAALHFDRSTGKLQFRGGGTTDVHAEINTSGEFVSGEGYVKLNKDGLHLLGKSIYTAWGRDTKTIMTSTNYTDCQYGTYHNHGLTLYLSGHRIMLNGVWHIAIEM